MGAEHSLIRRIAQYMIHEKAGREVCGPNDVIDFATEYRHERRALAKFMREDPCCATLPGLMEKIDQVACYVQTEMDEIFNEEDQA